MAQKWHQETPVIKIRVSKGGLPQVPEEYVLCQEAQQERPEEDAGQQRKGVSARAEAIKALVKPQVIKPKMPKGPSRKLSLLAFIAHPKLGKKIRSYMAMGQRLCQPKPKVQTKAGAKAPAKAQASAPAQAPKGAQAPVNAP
ncbi:60S ribosomal protein L29-like [Mastomys coucha]|uniref:60S ribosomal protein L29-like n=1 Tax=Mastomys coucha TaxID=35658 RepID=UPI001262A098|nr:60S ribosomal protein L29-like [Mastomys coucha]